MVKLILEKLGRGTISKSRNREPRSIDETGMGQESVLQVGFPGEQTLRCSYVCQMFINEGPGVPHLWRENKGAGVSRSPTARPASPQPQPTPEG